MSPGNKMLSELFKMQVELKIHQVYSQKPVLVKIRKVSAILFQLVFAGEVYFCTILI
jgi:hypothetical protein